MKPEIVNVVEACAHGSHDGSLSFPEIVGRLLAAGVTNYHADFFRAETTYYLSSGESHVVPLPMPDMPIATAFDISAVQAAIQSSQTEAQRFPDFLKRAVAAGCIGYMAYLDGKRVAYVGRLGDTHVEWFPGANAQP